MGEVETIKVGVARANITPPVGIRSAGYASRGPLTSFHDPLYATAIVFESGGRKAALISCDLIDLDAGTVGEVREEVAKRTSIPPEAMTVVCTHTHYGPDPYRDKSAPDVMAYRSNLIFLLAGAVQEADSKLEPALIGVEWGESDIGINRREKLPDGRVVLGRNPLGPIDRSVGVMRIDSADGKGMAVLVNFQCHPVSQGSRVSHISADYPGAAREVVERLTGATFIFLQGACGDINSTIREESYEPARTLGVRLGCEVVRVWEMISPQPVSGLEVRRREVELPRFRFISPERARELEGELSRELERLKGSGAYKGMIEWVQARLERVREALKSWESGEPLPPIKTELQAWRIGDEIAFAAVPGEIFNQIGLRVKLSSPFKHTFFLGYANDSIGYVPTPDAYPEGGYEVMQACRVDPQASEIIVRTCEEMLRELKGCRS